MASASTRTATVKRGSQDAWPHIRVISRGSKRVWEVDTGANVSNRTRKRFSDEDSALAYADMLRAQRRNAGMTAFTPTAAQRENIRAALRMIRRSGAKFRQAAVSFANQGPMAGANKTMNDLWHELASFKDKIQQKSPEYMRDLRDRLRQITGQVEDQISTAVRKTRTAVSRSTTGKKTSSGPKVSPPGRRKSKAPVSRTASRKSRTAKRTGAKRGKSKSKARRTA